MQVYTVHRRNAGLFAGPEVALVKEGFCWPAFLFGWIWALWHRMWLTALLLLMAEGGLAALASALDLAIPAQAALGLGFMVLVGFSANDWRRRALHRRGFEESGVIAAADRDAAEWRLVQAEAA